MPVTSGSCAIVGTGFVRSSTVTRCWQVAKLPELSRTVQVTVVVPVGKLAGALLVNDRGLAGQLSVATGKGSTGLAVQAGPAGTVISGEQVRMIGFSTSRIVILNDRVVTLPEGSAAV